MIFNLNTLFSNKSIKTNFTQIIFLFLLVFVVQANAKAQKLDNYKNDPKKLKQIYDTSKNEKLKAEASSKLAMYYYAKGDVDVAVTHSLQAISLQKKIFKNGDTSYAKKVAEGLAELALMYLNMGLPEQAKQYTEESKPYIINDKEQLSVYYKNMAESLRMYAQAGVKDIREAKVYYDSLTRYCQNSYPKSWHKRIALDLTFADYYLSIKDYKTASEYILLAKSLAPKWADETLNSQIIYMVGTAYELNHEYAKAIPYLKEAEKYAKNWNESLYVNLLNSIANVYGKTGQYENAYKYYLKYVPLRDSIYQKATEKSFMEAEAKFQNIEKTQQIKVKNLEIKNTEKQKVWLMAGAGLLLLTAILLFVIYKNKKKAAIFLDKKNKQLDTLNEQLISANQTKATLFSIISHDLRSPVSQLFTFLRIQQINPDQISAEQKDIHQKKLLNSATNLLSTMEDLLLWSKSQMEHFELEIDEIDVAHLFEESRALMQNQADGKNIIIEIGKLTLENLKSDYNLLLIILRNLLQNAINHSFDDTVIHLNAGNINEQSFISMINQGTIIPAEKIDELLNNNNVKSKSSGYGLLIVKELLEKLNAELTIESTENATTMKIMFK